MQSTGVKETVKSHFRSNLAWNMIAIVSIIATILAFYSYRFSYVEPGNGAANFRYNIIMAFFLILIPVFTLVGIKIRWTAIALQIIPIVLFLAGTLAVELTAFWPASLINYLLVYRFFQRGTSSTSR